MGKTTDSAKALFDSELIPKTKNPKIKSNPNQLFDIF